MASRRLRISPSGPDIVNAYGGEFIPGDGAMMRLNEAGGYVAPVSINATQLIWQASPSDTPNSPFTPELANPKPGLKYKISAWTEIRNNSTNPSEPMSFQFFLEYSIDGGTVWTEIASNHHAIGGESAHPTQGLFRIDTQLILGEDLGITESTTSLKVRAKASAEAASGIVFAPFGGSAGSEEVYTTLIQLSEHF